MSFSAGILNAGLSFLVLFAIFRPLELAYPAKKEQRFFRPQWWTDFCFLVGQYLFFNGAVLWVLTWCEPWVRAATPHVVRDFIGRQHMLAQTIFVVVLG